MNPGDQGYQGKKRKAQAPTLQLMAPSEKDKKKERITPFAQAFYRLKDNVTGSKVEREDGQLNMCNLPFSAKNNNTQVVQNSLLSQQAIQASTKQVMTRQVQQDGSMVCQFNGNGGNSYSHHNAGAKTEVVFATSSLPRSGVAAQDSTGDRGFHTEERDACLSFCGDLGVARELLISQIEQRGVGTIAFCTSTNDRDIQDYKYIEKQHFTRWFGKAIDRIHDIDEHKKGQLSQSVFYQRWSAELTSVPPDQIGFYLDRINYFYLFIGNDRFFKKKSDSFNEMFGLFKGQPLTFIDWWRIGHPELMKKEDYKLSKMVGVNSVKNRMVDGLVLSLNRAGHGFVLPTDDTIKDGFVRTIAELKTLDEESDDAVSFNKAMDVIGQLGPAVTNVLFSHASALKSTEKTDTITYERIDALKHSHKGQMPTDFFTMDSPSTKLDAGPKKKLAEEKTRKYPEDGRRRSLFALGPNGSRSYDMATMTNGGIVVERQSCRVISTPILSADSFARQIDTAWSEQVNTISAELGTVIQQSADAAAKVTASCTFLTTAQNPYPPDTFKRIFMSQMAKQYQGNSIPLWNELKKLDAFIKTATNGPHGSGQAARDRTLAIAKQLTKIATNEGCVNANEGQLLPKLENFGKGWENFTGIVSPLVGELYKCINVLQVQMNVGDAEVQLLAWGQDDNLLPALPAEDQARLKSLIAFVTTLHQPPPPLFLTKVHLDNEGKFYVSVHPNRYYPLGILPPDLFVFNISGEPYLPVEIINALEVCFRRKVSTKVYDKLVAEDDDTQKTQREIDRMAKFLRTDVTFNGSEEFTSVLTSRMMVEDRNKLSKSSIKTSRYTQRSNMLDNVSKQVGIVTASPDEVANKHILEAPNKDIFIDALTTIMPVRFVEDETQLPDQSPENNLYTVINNVIANSFLPGRVEVYSNPQYAHANWDAFEKHIQKFMKQLLCCKSAILASFLNATRKGTSPDQVNQAKASLFHQLSGALVEELNRIRFIEQTSSGGSGGMVTWKATNEWTKLGYAGTVLTNFLQNFSQMVQEKLDSTTFPQLNESDDAAAYTGELIRDSGSGDVGLSGGETQALSGGETNAPSKYIHDANHPTVQNTMDNPHPLLKVIIEEMDEDSRYTIGITSEVMCIQLKEQSAQFSAAVSFNSPASVKIVRIKMFESFVTFLNILSADEKAMEVVKNMYFDYASKLLEADQLTQDKFNQMDFDTMWPIFVERIIKTSATTATASAVKDDEEEDNKSSSTKNIGIISPNVQIFGRHFDGISAESKYGDEAPHILKNVIKDFACQLLQLRCGGLGDPAPDQGYLLTSISAAIQNAAIQYILADLASQKGKTTGDYVQKVEVQMDNLLWSTDWQSEFNRKLHITGFGSFDRIATILAAIDDVPTICINASGVTIGVGGINYEATNTVNVAKLVDTLGPDRLVRIELMSSIRDLNWMIPGEHIPKDTLPYIRTILVLKTMWIDVFGTVDTWDQYIGTRLENLEDLDNVSGIINDLMQTILNQLGGSLAEKQSEFSKWLNNKKHQLDNIFKRDTDALGAKCSQFSKAPAQISLDQARIMRDNIFKLLTTNTIENNDKRGETIKTSLGIYFPPPKKGGGSRKRRHRRRKTRRKKKRRKRKSIKKRRKRGRKTRRK